MAVDGLDVATDLSRNGGNRGDAAVDVHGFIKGETADRAGHLAHAAGVLGIGDDGEAIGTERGDLALDGILRGIAKGEHDDDGGDANNDAERRQAGAELVAPESARGLLKIEQDKVPVELA